MASVAVPVPVPVPVALPVPRPAPMSWPHRTIYVLVSMLPDPPDLAG